MRPPVLVVTFVGLIPTWPAGLADETQLKTLSVPEIVERLKKTYANCKTYRDSGAVKTVFLSENRKTKRTEIRPFTTVFVRPDQLRYEFKSREGEEEWSRYIVWSNGSETRTWWDINNPKEEKVACLSFGLAGATGVSGGSALTVPSLLVKLGIESGQILQLSKSKTIEEDQIGKRKCFKIRLDGEEPVAFWIDQGTYLILRIDEHSKFKDFETETTTTYDPQIDVKIPPKLLEFGKPEEKK
jgi:outer membrane lipoprotein-sorting protein